MVREMLLSDVVGWGAENYYFAVVPAALIMAMCQVRQYNTVSTCQIFLKINCDSQKELQITNYKLHNRAFALMENESP